MTPSVFPSSVCHILGKVLPESKGQRHWIHTFQYWKGALEILQRSKGQREPPGKWGESITFASCKWGETCFWACMIWLPSRGCSSWLCGHSWSCIFYKRGLEEFNLFTLKKKRKKTTTLSTVIGLAGPVSHCYWSTGDYRAFVCCRASLSLKWYLGCYISC